MPGESSAAGRRVGLLGGTFDPPHVGHLIAARAVAHALSLDEVRFVVAGDPWQKSSVGEVTEATHRLAMTACCVADVDDFVVSDIEVRREGPSYSADTLVQLTGEEPGTDWYFIVGSDAAEGLDTWHRPDTLARLATIVVVQRPPRIRARPPEGFAHRNVASPLIDLSSSELRERFATGEPVRWMVPDEAIAYVRRNGLYGVGPMAGPRRD